MDARRGRIAQPGWPARVTRRQSGLRQGSRNDDGPAWVGQRRVVEDALALGDAPLMHSLGRDEKWPAEWWQLHLLYGDAFAILMQVKPDWRGDLQWEVTQP